MDVYLGLAAGSDAVEQGDALLQERELYLVVGILLRCAEGLDTVEMWLAAIVEASYFLFVGLDETAFNKGGDRGEGVTLIEQFIAGNTHEIVYS